MERQISTRRLIYAFLIAAGIFILMFLLSFSISYLNFQKVASEQQSILYDLLNSNAQDQLVGVSCGNSSLVPLSKQLDDLGSVIGLLETKMGKENPNVIASKELYTAMEVQHFLQIIKYNKNCNISVETVLFFYSNIENPSASETTGYILSTLKTKDPNNLMIYSFDYDLNIPIINTLKEKYSIEKPNTVIINETIKLSDITNIEQMQNYLK
jgi:hypothetical protein